MHVMAAAAVVKMLQVAARLLDDAHRAVFNDGWVSSC